MEARTRKLENTKDRLKDIEQQLKILNKKRRKIRKDVEAAEWELHHPIVDVINDYLFLPLVLICLSYLNIHWCMDHKQLSFSGVCLKCAYQTELDKNTKNKNYYDDDDDNDDGEDCEEDYENTNYNLCSWKLRGKCDIHVTKLASNLFNFCLVPTNNEDELIFEEWRKIGEEVGFRYQVACTIHPYRLQTQDAFNNTTAEDLSDPLEEEYEVSVYWGKKGLGFLHY